MGSRIGYATASRLCWQRPEPDELMFNGPIVDHQARLRSFEIGAELMRGL